MELLSFRHGTRPKTSFMADAVFRVPGNGTVRSGPSYVAMMTIFGGFHSLGATHKVMLGFCSGKIPIYKWMTISG